MPKFAADWKKAAATCQSICFKNGASDDLLKVLAKADPIESVLKKIDSEKSVKTLASLNKKYDELAKAYTKSIAKANANNAVVPKDAKTIRTALFKLLDEIDDMNKAVEKYVDDLVAQPGAK